VGIGAPIRRVAVLLLPASIVVAEISRWLAR
jgi:hypothetical protein